MISLSQDAKGFISGAFAGISQVFVMQPFEIIKLRQVNEHDGSVKYHGFLKSFRTILQEEGIAAFYKGTKSPLIGYSLQCSLQFGFNRYFRKTLADLNGKQTDLTLLTASVLTGIPSAISVAPADHMRILMQKQDHGGKQNYRGELQAARDIIKRHGVRGLYLGFNCTLVREFLAMGIYFSCFEFIKRKMSHDRKGSWKEKLKIMLAGGIAGLASWIIGYPIDFLKTKLQSQDLDDKRYTGMRDCFQQTYRKYGLKVFTRGLVTVCLRSIPVNSVGFLVEEQIGMLLKRRQIE